MVGIWASAWVACISPALGIDGFGFFLLFLLALDSVWYLSINSGALEYCQDQLLKSNEPDQNKSGEVEKRIVILGVCLPSGPGPFFFCVFKFSSEATEPGNFLV